MTYALKRKSTALFFDDVQLLHALELRDKGLKTKQICRYLKIKGMTNYERLLYALRDIDSEYYASEGQTWLN